MFSDLYYTLFPQLGRIFGILIGLADFTIEEFLGVFSGSLTQAYEFVNLFNGQIFTETIPGLGFLGSIFSTVFKWFIPKVLYNLPVWFGLLYCSFTIFIGIYIIRFFISLIP